MKKFAKIGIILAVICALLAIGYLVFFHNADILKVDGDPAAGEQLSVRNAKPSWLVARFAEDDAEQYYKLADVTAPTGYKADKEAAEADADPLTTQFAYKNKDGDISFLIFPETVTAEELPGKGYAEEPIRYISDGSARSNSKEKPDIPAYSLKEDGKISYLIASPYTRAFIRMEMSYPADAEADRVGIAAYSMAEKIVPGKQLHPFIAEFKLNFIDDNRWSYLLDGLGMTMLITLVSGLMGVLLGAVVAAIRSTWQKNNENMRSGFGKTVLKIADKICGVYLTVIRGTPMMVQLLIMYLIIFASSSNGTLAAILAFGINSGAYVAEIIRGGIMSIDNGQFEAGRSLGFNYLQTMLYIILPQVFKNILPTLANEFIALLKETSVSGYVAVRDLNKGGEIIRSVTYAPFLPLLAVAAIYLGLVMFFTWLVGKLERRLRSSDH